MLSALSKLKARPPKAWVALMAFSVSATLNVHADQLRMAEDELLEEVGDVLDEAVTQRLAAFRKEGAEMKRLGQGALEWLRALE